MGTANMKGAMPNPKSSVAGICSIGDVWDGKTRSDQIKQNLQNNNSYIEIDEFCAPLQEFEIVGEAIGAAAIGIATGGIGLGVLAAAGGTALGGLAAESVPSLGALLCNNIGDNGQWAAYDYPDNQCSYNDCKPGYKTDIGAGCNGRCCAITGGTVGCARVRYTGDPVVCCLNDYSCDKSDEKCFQTPEQQGTCDPKYRDITSAQCRDLIFPYCTGDNTFAGQNDWLEMWLENSSVPINSNQELSDIFYPETEFSPAVTVSERGAKYPQYEKQPCLRAIARNITMSSICSWDDIQEGEIITTNVNQDGLQWSRKMLRQVFDRFQKESGGGSLLSGINTDGINKDAGFYNTLWNICNKAPLLCTTGEEEGASGILPDLCKNITAEDIIETPEALNWCGCHMPKEQYQKYQDKFGLPRECTPLCNQFGIIPSIDTNGEPRFCQDNTCIIDEANINLVNSRISGGVNFTQICPGCGKNSVNRVYTRNGGSSDSNPDGTPTTGSQNIYSFALSKSQSTTFLANYYNNVYGGYFSKRNFNSNNGQLFLKCLYFPEALTNKNIREHLLVKINNVLNPGDSPVFPISPGISGGDEKYILGQVKSTKTTLKDYLDDKYGFHDVEVIFGLLSQSNCIGYVNAGFKVKADDSTTLTRYENLYKTGFAPIFLSNQITLKSGYLGYPALELDLSQICSKTGALGVSSNGGFKKISNTLYTESIVSETTSKFSTGKENGKVKSNTCTCIMDGVNLSSVNSQVNGSINFTQECGKSKCYAPDGSVISCADNNRDPPPVPTIEDVEIETAIQLEEEKYNNVFYILSCFMVLLLFLIIYFELAK